MTERRSGIPPLVYVGPTLTEDEVLSVLPGAEVRPPIRRGDLYRDRMLRYSAFVVIDGVFHQDASIPLREIVDVLRDGAWSLGASSMGAIRAAECWPAGMEGVGSIYRLFRRGVLDSDDEVAVSFDPENPRHSTVALINIRHAVRVATRAGHLEETQAVRIVNEAKQVHYPDRRWRHLLRLSGIDDDGRLEATLRTHDLKRRDARRALQRAAQRLSADPTLAARPRLGAGPFVPSETRRERSHSALDGRDPAEAMADLAGWMISSGRIRRYLTPDERAGDRDDVTDRLAAVLASCGETDAELFSRRAVATAATRCHELGVAPDAGHFRRAEVKIAIEHGRSSFGRLVDEQSGLEDVDSIRIAREALAWAMCLRDALGVAP